MLPPIVKSAVIKIVVSAIARHKTILRRFPARRLFLLILRIHSLFCTLSMVITCDSAVLDPYDTVCKLCYFLIMRDHHDRLPEPLSADL